MPNGKIKRLPLISGICFFDSFYHWRSDDFSLLLHHEISYGVDMVTLSSFVMGISAFCLGFAALCLAAFFVLVTLQILGVCLGLVSKKLNKKLEGE